MNEHQTSTWSSSGTRDDRMAPAGALGAAEAGQDLGSYPAHARPPHRPLTRRDETIRAGQHSYRNAGAMTAWQDNTLPMVAAAGIGGGLLFGWLLSRMGGSSRSRSEWERSPYSPERRWSEQDYFGARSGGYASRSSRSVATDETRDLIASDKVEGTAVYDRSGERLGSVYNFMVGKRSGQVAYAVLSFGGWLGMGESYHPLPWNTLTYDTDLGGYVVSLSKDRLRNAPSHRAGHDASDAGYWRRVKDYWA